MQKSLAGGVRRVPVAGTMRVDAVAVAARWRPAWRPPAPGERTAVVACRGPANVGTNRGRGASRWCSGTWAYHNAAIPVGGCWSGADPRRSSAAHAGDVTPYRPVLLYRFVYSEEPENPDTFAVATRRPQSVKGLYRTPRLRNTHVSCVDSGCSSPPTQAIARMPSYILGNKPPKSCQRRDGNVIGRSRPPRC